MTLSKKQLITKEELEQHKHNYIHVPFSWKGFGRFCLFLGSLGLSILNFFLIIRIWKDYNVLNKTNNSFSQLIILYPLIGEYILIGLIFICLTALIKGGFNKIKSHKKEGLIAGLIGGLLDGLIGGLIMGLIVGSIVGSIVGLIVGLIVRLIREFK